MLQGLYLCYPTLPVCKPIAWLPDSTRYPLWQSEFRENSREVGLQFLNRVSQEVCIDGDSLNVNVDSCTHNEVIPLSPGTVSTLASVSGSSKHKFAQGRGFHHLPCGKSPLPELQSSIETPDDYKGSCTPLHYIDPEKRDH